MQPNVLPPVFEALLGVEPGRPEAVHGGLVMVPLTMRRRRGARPDELVLPAVAGAGELVWRERSPRQPRAVEVLNPWSRRVVVDSGSVLEGGMATRAVTRTILVRPGETTSVGVEPLGSRWWDEGAVRRRGRLGAVAAALLLQAEHGDPASACSARTLLWSLRDDALMRGWRGGPTAGPTRSPVGWALVLDGDAVAAWLPDRAAVGSALPPARWDGATGRGASPPSPSMSALCSSLSAGVQRGDLIAHLLDHGDEVRDLVVVPHDLRLVDQVVALASA